MSLNKSNRAIFFNSRWFLAIVSIGALLASFAFGRAFYRDYKVNQEIENLRDQIKELEAKKMESFDMLNYVKSDEFVRTKSRSELNMVKQGENTTVIKSKTGDNLFAPQSNNMIQSDKVSNPIKWWNFFFNQS